MMKRFEKPEIKISCFQKENIITISDSNIKNAVNAASEWLKSGGSNEDYTFVF